MANNTLQIDVYETVCSDDDSEELSSIFESLTAILSKVDLIPDESAHEPVSPEQQTAREALSALEDSILGRNRGFHGWKNLPAELQAIICEYLPMGSLAEASRAHSTLRVWAQEKLLRQMILDFRNRSTLHDTNPLSSKRDKEEGIDRIRNRIQDVMILLPLDGKPRDSRCNEIAEQLSQSMKTQKLRTLYVLSSNKGDEDSVQLESIDRVIEALPCETLIVQDDILGEPLLVSGNTHSMTHDDQDTVTPSLRPVNNLVSIGSGTSSSSWKGTEPVKSFSAIDMVDAGIVSWVGSMYRPEADRLVTIDWSEALTTNPHRSAKLYAQDSQVTRPRKEDDEPADETQDKSSVVMDIPVERVMNVESASRELSRVLDYVREMRAEVESRRECLTSRRLAGHHLLPR